MYSPEQQYQELNKKMLDAMEKYFRTGAKSDKREYQEAVENYQNFCAYYLEKLMEENADILKRLKNV